LKQPQAAMARLNAPGGDRDGAEQVGLSNDTAAAALRLLLCGIGRSGAAGVANDSASLPPPLRTHAPQSGQKGPSRMAEPL